ncbi:MAG: hypothetical protein QMC70_09275, partial [Bacteroidia bacterium]
TNQYIDQNFDIQTEIATTKVSRLNIALRPLFHYGDGDRLDLYSGIRVGYLMRNVETETNDELLNVLGDLDGNRFALGLVPFGMRYFFTDNLGVNMDLQIGTPYVVSGGIAFTF